MKEHPDLKKFGGQYNKVISETLITAQAYMRKRTVRTHSNTEFI